MYKTIRSLTGLVTYEQEYTEAEKGELRRGEMSAKSVVKTKLTQIQHKSTDRKSEPQKQRSRQNTNEYVV